MLGNPVYETLSMHRPLVILVPADDNVVGIARLHVQIPFAVACKGACRNLGRSGRAQIRQINLLARPHTIFKPVAGSAVFGSKGIKTCFSSHVMSRTVLTPECALLHERPLRHVRPFMSAQRHMRQTPRRPCRVAAASEAQQDFVTRWYGKIFGQKALDDRNPFGMKRLVNVFPKMFVQIDYSSGANVESHLKRRAVR